MRTMHVASYVGLTGTGGVQRSFSEYYAFSRKASSDVVHTVYTYGIVEDRYLQSADVHDLSSIVGILRFVRDLYSRETIVHIYNRTLSRKLACLLSITPVRKLVVHERGVVWNASENDIPVVRFITRKATVVLANSEATKQLLIQRCAVTSSKIRVIHNGVDVSHVPRKHDPESQPGRSFRVGYLGRMDTPKGVNVLIEAICHIPNSEKIELVIAGDGPLEETLLGAYGNKQNVSFIGAVDDPYTFLAKLDLLVVPSIREPLGNVCIEAGLCGLAVLAARVDGIPEIIEDRISGELMEPTLPIEPQGPEAGAAPLPEWVFDPRTRTLRAPLQLDPRLLADRIVALKDSPEIRKRYGEGLHARVRDHFSLDHYVSQLHRLYRELGV